MNSSQRKQFKKKIYIVTNKFIQGIEQIISNYDADKDVITVADLKFILEALKNEPNK